MRAVRIFAFVAALILASVAVAQQQRPPAQQRPPVYEDPSLDNITWDRLETFRSERDFLNYLRAARAAARERGFWWAAGAGPHYAQAEEVPCPEGETCPEEETAQDSIAVTGSRASARAPAAASPGSQASAPGSITNTQKLGVDEGDIVKQFGQFLIVLQDGRLFTVDTRPANGSGLALVDRANVYRTRSGYTWYDEMLVYQNRIVVTGYSYGERATEVAVFAISDSGALAHEGTYFLSSNDYYDIENYATRLVDGRLVIYSPLSLQRVNPDQPLKWPLVRRWLPEGDSGRTTAGTGLFNAENIYRPVQRTLNPVVHTVSVCPLGSVASGDELDCSATAFVGPPDYEYYVSRTHAYLWIAPGYGERQDTQAQGNCPDPQSFERGLPAALFQIPLSGQAPRVMMVRGEPKDQFSLETSDREFRALLMWGSNGSTQCKPNDSLAMRYFSAPLHLFRTTPVTPSRERYAAAPSPGAQEFENRFTDHYVVYGGRSSWGSYPPESAPPQNARVVALPVARPRDATTMEAPHDIIRIERAGDNIVLTGYRDRAGLSVSLVDLRAAPRLASTEVLQRRYESEGRSHAFNSLIEADGSGLMGLPTVLRTRQAGRWWWWSGESDVSFLSVDAGGQLRSIGPLNAGKDTNHHTYRCEVSCVDWYGNARPIFTDGRIFALTGVEIIEGAAVGGRMREVRRVNLTTPLPEK